MNLLLNGISVVLSLVLSSTIFAQNSVDAAQTYFQKGLSVSKNEEKIKWFSKTLEIDPAHEEALYRLGVSYYRKTDFQNAISTFSRVPQASKFSKETRLYLRNAYIFRANKILEEENYEEALRLAKHALEIDSLYTPALTLAAVAHQFLHEWITSIPYLKRALEIDTEQAFTWRKLGAAYFNTEVYTQAIRAYKRSLLLEPGNKEATFHVSIAQKRNRPELWLEKFEKALADGDSASAVTILELASDAHPDNQAISLRLKHFKNRHDYLLAMQAIERKEWPLAHSLLTSLDFDYADVKERLVQAKAQMILDSLQLVAKDVSASRKAAELASKRKGIGPVTRQEPVKVSKTKSVLLKKKATRELTQQRVEPQVKKPEVKTDKETMAPAESLLASREAVLPEREKAEKVVPFSAADGFRDKRSIVLLAALSMIFLTLLIFKLRKRAARSAKAELLKSTLSTPETVEENAGPRNSGDTFYDDIASKTPVTFADLTKTDLAGAKTTFDETQENTTLSAQETKTIIGGIKKATRIGRYVIEKEVGRGSMGLVFKAWDPKLDRTVVVKQVTLASGGSSETSRLQDRLYREARAAGKLNHPNIITIHDVEADDHCSYIVMEYLEGKNLQQTLSEEIVLPFERSVDYFQQICAALSFAHQNDIVHRDIKPSNIIISGKTVKVADFGIAKLPHSGTLTRTGDVVGTPFYMSPEQIEGRAVDARSDIFSAGVLFYEMITGLRPFDGDNIPSIVYKIVHQRPNPASKIIKDLPPAIDAIFNKALAKEPDERFESVLSLSDAVSAL